MKEDTHPKWQRDYHGFESVIDFDSDWHFYEAVEAVTPNNEWNGTVRITIQYIPEEEK